MTYEYRNSALDYKNSESAFLLRDEHFQIPCGSPESILPRHVIEHMNCDHRECT